MKDFKMSVVNNSFNSILVTMVLAMIAGLSMGLHVVDAINASAMMGLIITVLAVAFCTWFAVRKAIQIIEKWSVEIETSETEVWR